MLTTVPKKRFTWDFEVQDDNQMPVGEVKLSAWRERGAISAQRFENKVFRESARGAFVLERNGFVQARAEKPSAFRRMFTIEHEGKTYTLKARSTWGRALVLPQDEMEIGKISPKGTLSRCARADLPEQLPLLLRLFVIWLTLLLWKRRSESSPG